MKNINKVFIATSLDGYIADKDGGIDWLHSIPNPDNDDMGYIDFINGIDAIVMGRNTYEVVCGFDMDWPYQKPVFVLSSRLSDVGLELKGKVEVVKGDLKEIIANLNNRSYNNLYIDGGKTIQSFLENDLIDEMTISIIPVLLGNGIPLFSKLSNGLGFECVESKIYLSKIVQNKFIRTR